MLNRSKLDFNRNFSIIDDVLVDYNGNTRHDIVISGLNNSEISDRLTAAVKTLNFVPGQVAEPYTKENYPVNTHGKFQYEISVEFHDKVKVKKRFQGTTGKGLDINVPANIMPYEGNYTLNINKLSINGKNVRNNSTVLKYHDTGRASNAFLSLLVPGLGDRRVTYGEKSGFTKGLYVYSFIGAGLVCKVYSDREYKKYHAATEQSEMDEYYKNANIYNQFFYACIGIGATVWIWDIIWVWHKGAQNTRAHRGYKQSHFGLYHHPELNATGLTYTVNF
jgi:hypothetical protein